MCDTLKCKDRLFILPSHEIVIDGKIDRGSNIRDYIMDSLIEPPKPGTIKFTMLEKENERLKHNLAYVEKARGVWRCRKFESIIDGTVNRCDFSDDSYSEESIDGEDDPDENEEDDEGEYEDNDEEGDTEDDTGEEEPSRKRKKI